MDTPLPRHPALVRELLARRAELTDPLLIAQVVKRRLDAGYDRVTKPEAEALWELLNTTMLDRSIPRPTYWKWTASNSLGVVADFMAGRTLWLDNVTFAIYAHLTFHAWYLLFTGQEPYPAFRRWCLDVNARLLMGARMRPWVEQIMGLPPEPVLTVSEAVRLRRVRLARGENREQFAPRLGVSAHQLARYERGESIPRAEVQAKIARLTREGPAWWTQTNGQ